MCPGHAQAHPTLWRLSPRFGILSSSSALRFYRFWPEGRVRLWEEKLQLRTPFAGNAATQWGTVQEDVALSCYMEACSPAL